MRGILRTTPVALVTVAASLGGCGRAPTPADQHAVGATVWELHCLACHTQDGGIGARLTQAGLASYGSAGRLVDYTRLAMPYGLGGTLTDDQYRAVVAYLLHEHGLLPDSVAVGSENGAPFSPTR